MPSTIGILSGAGSLKNPAEPDLLGYRVNYIKNPSFEVDTSGWGTVGGSTLSRETGFFNTGSACAKVTNLSASAIQTTERIPFLESQGQYWVSAYVLLDAGASTANYFFRQLQYETLTSSGTVAAGNFGITSLSYTGNWVRLSASFTRNTIANYFVIRVSTSSTVSGEVFFVDSVMVEKSDTEKPYFDGSSNGFWTGAPHNSYSGSSPYL